MRNSLVIAFSITICFIAFVISKIVISVLLYKRWRRKHLIHEEGYPGMEAKDYPGYLTLLLLFLQRKKFKTN